MSARYVVYGVDRAGVPWECGRYYTPEVALLTLWTKRQAKTHGQMFGVYDDEFPEAGDCESKLDEMTTEVCE